MAPYFEKTVTLLLTLTARIYTFLFSSMFQAYATAFKWVQQKSGC